MWKILGAFLRFGNFDNADLAIIIVSFQGITINGHSPSERGSCTWPMFCVRVNLWKGLYKGKDPVSFYTLRNGCALTLAIFKQLGTMDKSLEQLIEMYRTFSENSNWWIAHSKLWSIYKKI